MAEFITCNVLAEEKEVEKAIVEAGEEAAFDAGVAGIHPEILKMLGRLKFRTSYGQNQLAHAVEVSKLSAVLAANWVLMLKWRELAVYCMT